MCDDMDFEGAVTENNKKAWEQLSAKDKETSIVGVVRYAILKWSSGAGYIEESEIKKLELPGLASCGAKVALAQARHRLRETFGMQLVPIWKKVEDRE